MLIPMGNLESPINLTYMFLNCGRKLENLEYLVPGKAKQAGFPGIKPETFYCEATMLTSSGAAHQATVLPMLHVKKKTKKTRSMNDLHPHHIPQCYYSVCIQPEPSLYTFPSKHKYCLGSPSHSKTFFIFPTGNLFAWGIHHKAVLCCTVLQKL